MARLIGILPGLFVLSALGGTTCAQTMTAAEIEAAVHAGQEGKDDQLIASCTATASTLERWLIGSDLHPDGEHFHVQFALTAGRIAALAGEAKRQYKPFGPKDIPRQLQEAAAFVSAAPHQRKPDIRVPQIEHVVLKSKNGTVVQPDAIATAPVPWPSAPSLHPPNQVMARFPLAPVRELPAGDFDVVLITRDGERKCKIGARDRERLFGGR